MGGDGKTSILNLLKKELKRDSKVVIVDFNPWMGVDEKVLIKDFFNSLSEKLSGNNISNDLHRYSKELLDEINNPIIKFINSIFNKDKSLDVQFNEINKKIRQLGKKTVIFVDDVDRLDSKEIFQLLKLIRNTANFNHTFFVVAYDRAYVNRSIHSINDYSSGNYLDKIINIELNLPYFDKSLLKELFRIKLIEKIGGKYTEKINYALNKGMSEYDISSNSDKESNDFINWISNIRNIKKIVNSIYVNFKDLFDEINFTDLIYLELLKMKYPIIYRMIFTKKNEFLKEINGHLYIKNLRDKSSENEIGNTIFGEYLKNYCRISSISELEREKIYNLFFRIFSFYKEARFLYTSTDKDQALSARYVNKFDCYFAQAIFKGNFSESEFEYFLNTIDSNERNKKIDNCFKDGKEKDLKFRLISTNSYKNKIQYESVLKSIMYINQRCPWSFDLNEFISKIKEKKAAELYNNKNEYKEFIKSVFKKAQYPYRFESEALSKIKKNNFSFVLDDNEVKEILKNYFENYIEETGKIDVHFWIMYNIYIFFLTSEKERKELREITAKKINSKDKFFKSFFLSLINKKIYSNLSNLRKEIIHNLCGSTCNFEEKFIDSIKSDDETYKGEFKRFYNVCERKQLE